MKLRGRGQKREGGMRERERERVERRKKEGEDGREEIVSV